MNDKERLKDLEEQKRKLSNEINRLYRKQRLEEYKGHKDYVGKCYKHKSKNEYYKVLSNYSTNTSRLTCLVFNLDDDVYQYQTSFRDYPDADVCIETFGIEDVFAFGVSSFFYEVIEISSDEFDEAQRKMIDKFIKETEEVSKNINNIINESKKYYLKEE